MDSMRIYIFQAISWAILLLPVIGCDNNSHGKRLSEMITSGELDFRQPADVSHFSKIVEETVDAIVAYVFVSGPRIGYAGTLSPQYKNYQKLNKYATDDELILLTRHEHHAVRVYAFLAIATRESINMFPILLEHLDDKREFQFEYYDMGSTGTVLEFYLKIAIKNNSGWLETKTRNITPNEYEILKLYRIELPAEEVIGEDDLF